MKYWFASFGGHADGAQPLKIVAFGTSLTARGGWQPALETRLAACLQRPVKVEIVAKSGETSLWALTQVDRVVAAQPDIILIELYANDATLHRFVSLAQSRKNIGDILDQLQQRLPQARIIVMLARSAAPMPTPHSVIARAACKTLLDLGGRTPGDSTKSTAFEKPYFAGRSDAPTSAWRNATTRTAAPSSRRLRISLNTKVWLSSG